MWGSRLFSPSFSIFTPPLLFGFQKPWLDKAPCKLLGFAFRLPLFFAAFRTRSHARENKEYQQVSRFRGSEHNLAIRGGETYISYL